MEALDRSFTFPRSALAVQLSTARAGLAYCPEARAFLQADWPIRGQDNPRCDARYQVFRDLRGRGFYLTSAGKFGGDFLVYPGQCCCQTLSFSPGFRVLRSSRSSADLGGRWFDPGSSCPPWSSGWKCLIS